MITDSVMYSLLCLYDGFMFWKFFFARNDDKSTGKWHLDSFPAADYVAAQCPEVLLFIVADLDVPLGIIAQQGERTLTRPRARGFLKNELTIYILLEMILRYVTVSMGDHGTMGLHFVCRVCSE